MVRSGVRSAAVAALSLACACSGDVVDPRSCEVPRVIDATVAANEANVLSAVVSAQVRGADGVAVRYGASATLDSITPVTSISAGDVTVSLPVLGLLPSSAYAMQVMAVNRCGAVATDAVQFTTGVLPADLPSYSAGGEDPVDGYVVFAAGLYGLAIDNTGRVVWYHKFAKGPGLNFQPQPNGRYVARPTPETGEIASWVEVDVLGRVTRILPCARGLAARLHDVLVLLDGSYWILCDETRTLDLRASGGPEVASVTGSVVQHVVNGTTLFEWSAFDHFELDYGAIDAIDRVGSSINWTHANAFDLDEDGNLYVSFRNLSEVTKIDGRTGQVVWRLGGRRNDFAFGGSTSHRFARQHGLRVRGYGEVMLLDNLGDPARSQALRYQVNELAKVSSVAASFAPVDTVIAGLGGSTQELPDGHVLVSYGNGSRVEEYDAAGTVVWRIHGNPGYVFRAQRVFSLYQPGLGLWR
jgi:hypothetical protein